MLPGVLDISSLTARSTLPPISDALSAITSSIDLGFFTSFFFVFFGLAIKLTPCLELLIVIADIMTMSKDYNKDTYMRTRNFLADEEAAMDYICKRLAEGGSLIDICKEDGFSYGVISVWLNKGKERNQRFMDALNARNEWYMESIKAKLRGLIDVDIRELFDEFGSVKDPKDWPDSIAFAISGFDVVERTDKNGDTIRTYKVKLNSREKGLELLGKNLSMFIEKHELSGTMRLEDIVAGSRKKKDEQQ